MSCSATAGTSTCPNFASLSKVLDHLPDPRRVWGRRYRLGSLLALCLLTVLGGATTPAGISRFAVGADPGLREKMVVRSAARERLGLVPSQTFTRRIPSCK
ncbi:transposase family protein [Streptomyces sp. NPDC057798]|uniref:transposase family protein n=1 Tax=Streptomyces sp. NPDC057798 TaxID=3346252 RepID=UPI0036C24927